MQTKNIKRKVRIKRFSKSIRCIGYQLMDNEPAKHYRLTPVTFSTLPPSTVLRLRNTLATTADVSPTCPRIWHHEGAEQNIRKRIAFIQKQEVKAETKYLHFDRETDCSHDDLIDLSSLE